MNEQIKNDNKKYGPDCIGNVIRILDDRTLVVNVGSPTLAVNTNIQVYCLEKPLHDVDGSIICSYKCIKDSLKVIRVEKEYAVCQKQDTQTTHTMFAISPLLEKVEYVSLNIDKDDIEPLEVTDRIIKVGDPIKMA